MHRPATISFLGYPTWALWTKSDSANTVQRAAMFTGLCKSVVLNYLNNVCKGKRIEGPIIFQGGVSKNKGVVKYFEEELKQKILVDENGHLMGAIGVAILSSKAENKEYYDLNIENISFKTIGNECKGCTNRCELLRIYRNEELLDTWGSKCGKY